MRSDTGPGGTSRGSNWSLRGAIGELEVFISGVAVINDPVSSFKFICIHFVPVVNCFMKVMYMDVVWSTTSMIMFDVLLLF